MHLRILSQSGDSPPQGEPLLAPNVINACLLLITHNMWTLCSNFLHWLLFLRFTDAIDYSCGLFTLTNVYYSITWLGHKLLIPGWNLEWFLWIVLWRFSCMHLGKYMHNILRAVSTVAGYTPIVFSEIPASNSRNSTLRLILSLSVILLLVILVGIYFGFIFSNDQRIRVSF